jgi:hypothetical protein
MRAQFINEKFVENSDPIHDMGIGNPEKSILPMLVKELAKYDIEAEWEKDRNLGKGFWFFSHIDLYSDDEDLTSPDVLLEYATDEAAKREGGDEGWKGGFSLYTDDGELIDEITHDIEPIVKKLVELKYGDKKHLSKKIIELEKKLNIMKGAQKIL